MCAFGCFFITSFRGILFNHLLNFSKYFVLSVLINFNYINHFPFLSPDYRFLKHRNELSGLSRLSTGKKFVSKFLNGRVCILITCMCATSILKTG